MNTRNHSSTLFAMLAIPLIHCSSDDSSVGMETAPNTGSGGVSGSVDAAGTAGAAGGEMSDGLGGGGSGGAPVATGGGGQAGAPEEPNIGPVGTGGSVSRTFCENQTTQELPFSFDGVLYPGANDGDFGDSFSKVETMVSCPEGGGAADAGAGSTPPTECWEFTYVGTTGFGGSNFNVAAPMPLCFSGAREVEFWLAGTPGKWVKFEAPGGLIGGPKSIYQLTDTLTRYTMDISAFANDDNGLITGGAFVFAADFSEEFPVVAAQEGDIDSAGPLTAYIGGIRYIE